MARASQFEIFDPIGSNHYANVYEACDTQTGEDVAIMELLEKFRKDAAHFDSIWEQIEQIVGLEHPSLVKTRALVKPRGWIVMNLMSGNLELQIVEAPLPADLVRSILRQALQALQFLHENQVIHGDVRPANLLHSPGGELQLSFSPGLFIGDTIPQRTRQHKYIAPETMNPEFGTIGPAVDLYGLGFSAVELLLGPAFDSHFKGLGPDSPDADIAWMRWQSSPSELLPSLTDLVPGVPADVARVIDRLVAKPVEKRHASAVEALQDLVEADIQLLDPRRSAKGRAALKAEGVDHIIRPREYDASEVPRVKRKAPADSPPPAARATGRSPGGMDRKRLLEFLQKPAVTYALAAIVPIFLFALYSYLTRPIIVMVRLETTPEGCQIRLDGKDVPALSPIEGPLVVGSEHRVALSLPGYKLLDESFKIDPRQVVNDQVILSWSLKPDRRDLHVVTQPEGAAVRVSGERQDGTSPLKVSLLPGSYKLRVEKVDHEFIETDVEIPIGAGPVELPPLVLRAYQEITIAVTPADSTVQQADQLLQVETGQAHLKILEGEGITISCSHDNYQTTDRTLAWEELAALAFRVEVLLSPRIHFDPGSLEMLTIGGQPYSLDPEGFASALWPAEGGVRIMAKARGHITLDQDYTLLDLEISGFRIELEALPPGAIDPPEGMSYIGRNDQGFFEYLNEKDGSVMILIPAGPFQMGQDRTYPDEAPRHAVDVSAMLFDKHEITQAQYGRFCSESGRNPPVLDDENRSDNNPILAVTHDEAIAYCSWAGKRMPTEAEWEKAAAGPNGQKYPWGEKEPPATGEPIANYKPASGQTTAGRATPHGSFEEDRSHYGVLDLAGNVMEWCSDWYDPEFYRQGRLQDPQGPSSGSRRVVRGGSFGYSADRLRCASRRAPQSRHFHLQVGIRGVRAVSTTPAR